MASKAATKTEILTNIAAATELSRKQVASVFDVLAGEIKTAVGKKGPGIFAVPGLMKIMVIHKPATKARRGSIPSPSWSRCSKPSPRAKSSKCAAQGAEGLRQVGQV